MSGFGRHVWPLTLAVFAAAVSGSSGASAAKIKMVFPGPATTYQLPYFVAQKKGWLGDLEVEEIYVTGDANALRTVISGNADIGLIGPPIVLASIEAKGAVRVINSFQPIGDYSLVLAKGKGTTLADLAGKTLATSGPGNLPDQLPKLIMKKHGIDDSTTRFVQVGGHAARLQAVIGGRADGTLINSITTLRGVQDGKITVVTKVSEEFPKLAYTWNTVKTSSLDNPALAAAFQTLTEASIRGSRYMMDNPDEAADALHDRFPDFDIGFLRTLVRDLNSEKLWAYDGGIDPDLANQTAKLNAELGTLQRVIPASEVLDQRFVDVALKKLGRYQPK